VIDFHGRNANPDFNIRRPGQPTPTPDIVKLDGVEGSRQEQNPEKNWLQSGGDVVGLQTASWRRRGFERGHGCEALRSDLK